MGFHEIITHITERFTGADVVCSRITLYQTGFCQTQSSSYRVWMSNGHLLNSKFCIGSHCFVSAVETNIQIKQGPIFKSNKYLIFSIKLTNQPVFSKSVHLKLLKCYWVFSCPYGDSDKGCTCFHYCFAKFIPLL